MSNIIQTDNQILRKTAKEVSTEKITSSEIQKILSDMKKTLSKEKVGVALAAPQINIPLRIFIVSGKIFKNIEDENAPIPSDLIFINPTITKISKDKKLIEEGCLSIRSQYGKIKRSKKVTVRAYDENGKMFERGGSGMLAQIFQHEIDHLNGILFTDNAKELYKIDK